MASWSSQRYSGLVTARFEWDAEKAARNEAKHGISFTEAATIFGDPLALTIEDPDDSVGEERFVTMGLSFRGRLLVVSHVDRRETIRIISARAPTAREVRAHEG